MIRLHFVVEGQTEATFVSLVLAPHLSKFQVFTKVRLVRTSPRGAGGLVNYEHAKADLRRWMTEDRHASARFTTMFDLYQLPNTFPGYAEAAGLEPFSRVRKLESAMTADIEGAAFPSRFVPYVQLHEFEALVLAEPARLGSEYPEHAAGAAALESECRPFDSPEQINDGEATAPSKRILAHVPGYEKVRAGPALVNKIGLPTLRMRCPHFGEWLSRLESLDERELPVP